MNTQLVDSFAERFGTKIVQMVETLPPAERELVKQRLSILPDLKLPDRKTELTLEDRRAFLRKPLAQRQLILAQQAQQMVEHYQTSTEWRELMAGDIWNSQRLKPPLVMRSPPTRTKSSNPRRRVLQYQRRFQSCGISNNRGKLQCGRRNP